jgi:hypothetical protein
LWWECWISLMAGAWGAGDWGGLPVTEAGFYLEVQSVV